MIDFTTQARPLHFMYITCAAILSHLLHIYSMCVWVQSCFIIYCCDTFPWIPLRLSGWSVSSLCAISSKNQQLLNCWGQMVVEVSLLCVHNQWPETVLKLEKKKKLFWSVRGHSCQSVHHCSPQILQSRFEYGYHQCPLIKSSKLWFNVPTWSGNTYECECKFVVCLYMLPSDGLVDHRQCIPPPPWQN